MTATQDGKTEPAQGAVSIWAEYAKDRYDAGEKRLADFRGWARQLAAIVGVIVGLEAALIGQVLKLEVDARVLGVCLVLLLVTAAWLLTIMARAVSVGYVGKALLAPESPTVLAQHLGDKDEAAALRMVAAYYAKGSDNVHVLAEDVSREMKGIVWAFKWSLWLLFMAMALPAGISAASSLHLRKAMTETTVPGPSPSEPAPSSPTVAAPAEPTPAPAATPQAVAPMTGPAPSPLLVTPTPGATETHGAHAPQNQALLSTPTQGQRITEGIEYRKK